MIVLTGCSWVMVGKNFETSLNFPTELTYCDGNQSVLCFISFWVHVFLHTTGNITTALVRNKSHLCTATPRLFHPLYGEMNRISYYTCAVNNIPKPTAVSRFILSSPWQLQHGTENIAFEKKVLGECPRCPLLNLQLRTSGRKHLRLCLIKTALLLNLSFTWK